MNKYTATFSDGASITRNAEREYAFAWRRRFIGLDGVTVTSTGLAETTELAVKASKPFLPYGTWRGMAPKDRAKAKEKNAEFLQTCNLGIEIVATVKN